MWTKVFMACVLVAAMAPEPSAVEAVQYYDGSNVVSLAADTSCVQVLPDSTIAIDSLMQLVSRIEGVYGSQYEIPFTGGYIACSLSAFSYDSAAGELAALTGVRRVVPCYVTSDGSTLFLTESFYAKMGVGASAQSVMALCLSLGVEVSGNLPGDSTVYFFRRAPGVNTSIIDLANEAHTHPEIEWAAPNFSGEVIRDSYKTYDYYRGYQWQTAKVVGAVDSATVWDFGGLLQPTLVAVVDDGVGAHEDLPLSRIVWGYDFANWDPNPEPGEQDSHGMACAGIIAASHTTDSAAGTDPNSGVIGLAPDAYIVSVGIFADCGEWYCGYITDSILAVALRYAEQRGAEILSCSWHRTYSSALVTATLDTIATYGRMGKGCPVFFSSGNMIKGTYDTPVRYPARLPSCFAVGSVDSADYRFWYSCFDSTLDIVAPSGEIYYRGDVWSIDPYYGANPTHYDDCPPDANDWDYQCHFGGTSAACPVASGVAALLLARDTMLTSGDVYGILRGSATPIPHAPSVPCNEYGYGRIDAFRAMLSIVRGDVDNDGNVTTDGNPDIADLTYFISFFFRGGSAPFPSVLLADVNCDGYVTVADATYLISYIERGGPPPVKPCFEY